MILIEPGIHDRLATVCQRHVVQYFVHVVRSNVSNLDKMIVQGSDAEEDYK